MPESFPLATLGGLAHVEMGQSPPSSTVHEEAAGLGGGVPFLQGNAEFGALHPASRLRCGRPLKRCRGGDALISVRAPVGALNCADQDYCIGRGLAAVRFSNMHPAFGYHALVSFAGSLHRVSQGTTFAAIGGVELRALELPNPPLPEQQRIAEILDTLDEAIRKTEEVIAKLQQVKQGLLHDLLTRGIDEHGELRDPDRHPEEFKDSAVGKIPQRWRCVSVGECLRNGDLVGVQDGNHGEAHPKRDDFVAEGVPFVMANNLVDGLVDVVRCYRISRRQYKTLRVGFSVAGDVLLSHKGTVGSTAIVDDLVREVMLTPQVTYYRPCPQRILASYLRYWFEGRIFQRQLAALSVQSTRAFLSISGQQNLTLVVPVPGEQARIAKALVAIDAKTRAEKRSISKLRKAKAALMHDLLTGRVRTLP